MAKTYIVVNFEQFLSRVATDNSAIDKIKSYVDFWEAETVQLDVRCSVCDYVLNKKKDRNIASKLQQLNSIGKQMPENLTGVLLVWLYIQHELTTEDERQAKKIDPLSILLHVIIGCCLNDKDAALSMDHLMKETIINTMKIHSEKEIKYDICQQFKEFIRQLGTCDEYNCLYADTGAVKLTLESRLLPDARAYISEDWIESNTCHSLVKYHDENHYITLQPGIDYHDNVNGEKRPSSSNSPTENPKMFLTSKNVEPLETEELLCMTKKKIEKTQHNLIRDAQFILSICSHGKTLTSENGGICSLINTSFPLCIWCSMCIVPGMRAIINDLSIMTKRNLTLCGIGCDVQQQSPLVISHNFHSRRKKRKINTSSNEISFNFDRYFLTKQATEYAFIEWKTEKYPILKDIYSDIDINSLWNHISLMGDLYCKKNIKRTYIDTDLHQQQNTYTCSIMHALFVLNILIKLKIKIQKEISKMQEKAIAHNLFINLSSVSKVYEQRFPGE